VNRRAFIASLGGAAAWPVTARAQQPAMPVIGFLSAGSYARLRNEAEAFRRGLGEIGYVEGLNLAIEYRWAEYQFDKLPGFVQQLARRPVALIVATGGDQSVVAATGAGTSIPVVFTLGTDPVKLGLVASLNRPGGNATGITQFTAALEPKRLELLREAVPGAGRIGVLVDPDRVGFEAQVADVQGAARSMGQEIVLLRASTEAGIEAAFATLVQQRAGALLVASDPFFSRRQEQIVALAARHALPAIYQWRDFPAIGGLMSYGTSLSEAYHQVGVYAGRILKGEKPAELPVVQATKVELVLNMRTAKALGLTFPITLLGRADEVIE
jgi:putative tryptophan/tyrosine transport system substrate-binding protein